MDATSKPPPHKFHGGLFHGGVNTCDHKKVYLYFYAWDTLVGGSYAAKAPATVLRGRGGRYAAVSGDRQTNKRTVRQTNRRASPLRNPPPLAVGA